MSTFARMPRVSNTNASKIAIIVVLSSIMAVSAAQALEESSVGTGGRQLQTVLAQNVADNAQANWRSAGNALLATLASVFTTANIELAKAALDEVAGVVLPIATPAPAPPAPPPAAAATAAQPVAQVVYLPQQDIGSGIRLQTSTPVSVGAPVNVDTPVQQDNVQTADLPKWLGGRRLS